MLERASTEAKTAIEVQPRMMRHACGFALANKGHNTRALLAYLGHNNSIQHTVRYTEAGARPVQGPLARLIRRGSSYARSSSARETERLKKLIETAGLRID